MLSSDALVPFSNERHAVIQIKGEKEILVFLMSFAASALELIASPSDAEFDKLLMSYAKRMEVMQCL